MLIVNQILFFLALAILVFPIIFIIVMVIYNGRVNKRIKALQREVNEKNVRKFKKTSKFIKTSKFGPFGRFEKRWEMLIDMFKAVNKSKKIPYELKEELYEVLVKRGCDKTKLNFKQKRK